MKSNIDGASIVGHQTQVLGEHSRDLIGRRTRTIMSRFWAIILVTSLVARPIENDKSLVRGHHSRNLIDCLTIMCET